MKPDAFCHCGHVVDEHAEGPTGPGACEIEDCDCVQFDEDEDDEGVG